jgi:peptidoglycan hydrolase-like protein with peptidoglycan-binding domain
VGSRKRVKYTADVIDSIRSDWFISDDGKDQGPIDGWPAPFLGTDDGSNRVPPGELRRAGSRSGMRFDGYPKNAPVHNLIPTRRNAFDDGGLNEEGRKRRFARDAFAPQREEDALFSRTYVGPKDSYGFLRRLDPGADMSYAPRRGPYSAISTSATMAGAGGFFAVSDAAGVGETELRPGEKLLPGQQILSKNRQYRLILQKDGNLVLYHPNGSSLWDSATVGRGGSAVMQTDGNFVVYDRANRPAWHAGTQGRGFKVAIQDDGNLVIYDRVNRPAWNAGTWGGVKAGSHESKSFLEKVGGAISSVGEGALSVGKGVVSAGTGLAKTVGNVVTSPARLVNDIAHGKNVLESIGDTVKRDLQSAKELAPYAQAVLSVVPGVGQGVNAAIAAGNAIAHGQPITDALVAGVKGMVPGGPLAQEALGTAYNLARGQSITDAVASAARNRLPEGPARQAFDTGLALAHGKNIQDLAKEQGMSFLENKLSPLASRAMSSTGPLIGQVQNAAVSVLPANVKLAAQALLKNPSLRSLPVDDVARRLGVPVRDVQHAVASVVQAAGRTGVGQRVRSLASAPAIADRVGTMTSFDQNLARFGSRMAPIAMGPNRSARRILPRYPRLMPGAMGLQDAGAFATIKLGSTGPDVQAWQKILGVTADGKFGPQTDAATRTWQRAHGLTPDGVVGPKTWAAASGQTTAPTPSTTVTQGPGTVTLPEVVIAAAPPPPLTSTQIAAANSMPTIKLGSSGPAVSTWQGILRRDSGISGWGSAAPDGQFGPITDAATRRWQASSGLTPDGVVGPQTWTKGIGSLTTAPLPAESAPGVALPTPPPPNLPPGLPPVPTQPASAPAPTVFTPPVLPPIIQAAPPPSIGVTTPPPPSPEKVDKAGGAVAALAIGGILAKVMGLF